MEFRFNPGKSLEIQGKYFDRNYNNNNNNNKRFYSLFCYKYSTFHKQNQVVLLCREMDFPAHISVYALAFG